MGIPDSLGVLLGNGSDELLKVIGVALAMFFAVANPLLARFG